MHVISSTFQNPTQCPAQSGNSVQLVEWMHGWLNAWTEQRRRRRKEAEERRKKSWHLLLLSPNIPHLLLFHSLLNLHLQSKCMVPGPNLTSVPIKELTKENQV